MSHICKSFKITIWRYKNYFKFQFKHLLSVVVCLAMIL
nr:MAG TPA: hypothetical protein [Caudoviricetes sp.]